MACDMKDCGSYIYPTLPKYMRHWHRIHMEHHDLLVIPRCTQNFEKLFFSHQTSSERPSFIICCKQRNGSESSCYKKKKLTNSSILQGIFFRQYFDKTTWKLRRTRIHQLKRENWQKRETEIEKNRQNWRNILLEEECNPDPRDEVIEFDEERNA